MKTTITENWSNWSHGWVLSNSLKLWAMPCRTTQNRQVMVESSDKTWSTGEGNGKPLQYSCLENPMNSMRRQNDRTLKEELPRLVGAQYATGGQWRNKSRKNEGIFLKRSLVFPILIFSSVSLHWSKAEESEIKLPTSIGSSKKQESSRKTSTSAFLTMPKHLCGSQQTVKNS